MVTEQSKPPEAGLYVLSIIFPIIGVIAGIVAFARGMIGPGIALWACAFWGGILELILLSL